MAVETELKLRIAPEHLNRLKRHPLLKRLSVARPNTRRLYNVYYDTPGLDLHRRAMALRLRRSGKQWLQTLKGGGGVQAGLHQRNEWEAPVDGEALDFEALKACGGQRLPASLRKKLKPLFVTDFSRTTRLLAFEGAQIELCMDSGEIRAGRQCRAISELELELKSGDPAQLFGLALVLLDIVPLEIEHTNKAEYGYRLCTDARPYITRATMPSVAAYPDVPSALQAMIWSCLRHLQANVPGAVQKLDEEYLHQVRVALRRLRVVLTMAENVRADTELSALHKQVAELCMELGRVREWDVFVTQTLKRIIAQLPAQPGLRKVLRVSEKLREQHHVALVSRLHGQDYQRFLLRFGAWMYGRFWREAAVGGSTLPRFVSRVLDIYGKQVNKRGKHLARAVPARLHKLRIACKKLRYGAEMFASLFDTVEAKRYMSALAAVQDNLGALNDIAVAHRLLDELDHARSHESTSLIRGWIERDYVDQVVKLNKAWKKFSKQSACWRKAASAQKTA